MTLQATVFLSWRLVTAVRTALISLRRIWRLSTATFASVWAVPTAWLLERVVSKTGRSSYDDADEVKQLARRHGFAMKLVALKTTHHATAKEWVSLPLEHLLLAQLTR
jgi:hypothetical protein